jgi:hypothetical protein
MNTQEPQQPEQQPQQPPRKNYLAMAVIGMVVLGINLIGLWVLSKR